jgi:hypothetical protein
MRRRRQTLQISTFPFLAVLLCAMGSLILLLLVIDRRAKIVAHYKALQAAAQATAEDEKAIARRAEWERRRRAVRDQLARQAQEVLAQIGAVRGKLETAVENFQAEQTRARALQAQVQIEQARLNRSEEDVAARRVEAALAAQQVESSQAERARLTTELEQLEQTLADLKAVRRRHQQTYSVVPYRGRRGDSRQPLYVECTQEGLIFHPDRVALQGTAVSSPEIRAEIERRIGRQQASASPGGPPEEKPYLFLLVRPDGIATYYLTQTAVRGLPIDFGYELIERDWVLDFSEGGDRSTPPPWMTAEKTDPGGSPAPAPDWPASRPPRAVFGPTGPTPGPGSGSSDRALPTVGTLAPEPAVPGQTLPLPPAPAPRPDRARLSGNPSGETAPAPPRERLGRTGTEPTAAEPAASLVAPVPGLPAAPAPNPARPVPPRPGLFTNRDWVVPLECTAGGLVLTLTGQRFPLAALARREGDNNPLKLAVQQLIARRQMSVRPGEPPYRPQIRFRVWPDGLRAYHLAYPALEALHVPMSRENVEREEEPKPGNSGR